MSLADVERALARVCLSPEPSEADLALLGERRRFLLYREMVRDRLIAMAGTGMPRTREVLGPAFQATAESWLAEDPPRTPFLREVVGRFADFAVPRWRADPRIPVHVPDLATFERTEWEMRWVPAQIEGSVAPFDFDRVPVLGGAHRLLALAHSVHEEGEPARGAFHVLVFRRPGTHATGWWVLNDLAAAFLREFTTGDATVAECVRRTAEARGLARDERFFEGLATVVAGLIERGVLVGSRG